MMVGGFPKQGLCSMQMTGLPGREFVSDVGCHLGVEQGGQVVQAASSGAGHCLDFQ